MKRLLIIIFLLIATPSWADTVEPNSAGFLATACRHAGQPTWENLTSTCVFTINGFMDGFIHGSDRGLRTAFIKDSENIATTSGAGNLQARIDALRKDAHCFPRGITVEMVAKAFIAYVDIHPEIANTYYADPLSDAIQTIVCNK
jgi:hypothetical protein